MDKMRNRVLIIFLAAFMMVGCTAIKNAYQMTKCEYSYKSISGVKVAGIDFSNITATGLLTALPKITKLISGDFSDIPVELTVSLNVKNPDAEKTAAVADIEYAANIDGLDIATGNLGKSFTVEPGKTAELPVVVNVNLGNIVDANNRATVVQIVKNFTGLSSEQSTIKLSVRPKLLSNSNHTIYCPTVPLTFKYGGKK